MPDLEEKTAYMHPENETLEEERSSQRDQIQETDSNDLNDFSDDIDSVQEDNPTIQNEDSTHDLEKPILEEFDSNVLNQESKNPQIDNTGNAMSARDLEAVYSIPVRVSAVLGKAKIQISQLLKLETGTIVELDRKVGEAIDIYVNDRLVARGEVVIVDGKLGVTMTEIIKSEQQ